MRAKLPTEPGRITATEAAGLAGIAPSTMRAMTARGQAPATGPDGFYDLNDVRHWIRNRPGSGFRSDRRGRKWEQN